MGGLLLLISAHLLSTGVKPGSTAAQPQGVVLEALRPFQVASARMADSASEIADHYLNIVGAAQENRRLRARLEQLTVEETQLHELTLENRRLADLLELREVLDSKAVAADVIGSDATGTACSIIIGEGDDSGIRPGMAVISAQGVVGTVVAVSHHAARVLLINDHNAALDAFDQRSRARGIVAGVIENGMVMKYVERTEDIKQGDAVITSGLDGVFPRGLLVGFISEVDRRGAGLFMTVEVKAAADIRRLEKVLVLTQEPPHMAEQGKS